MKPETAVLAQETVLIAMLEAAIQKIDQEQFDLARELSSDLIEKLRPAKPAG